MAIPRAEKAYEKYAWIIFFAIGTFRFLTALTHVTGVALDVDLGTASTALVNFIRFTDRELGIDDAAFGALTMAISATSYRRGDRWAWYALFTVPVFFLGEIASNLIAGRIFGVFLFVFVITALLGLLLPYRKFFPAKERTYREALVTRIGQPNSGQVSKVSV